MTISFEHVNDPELRKKLEQTASEHNRKEKMSKARDALSAIADIRPVVEPKPEITCLGFLDHMFGKLAGSEHVVRHLNVYKTRGYGSTVTYTSAAGGFAADFKFRPTVPVKYKPLGRDVIESIEQKKAEAAGSKFAVVQLDDVTRWVERKFGDRRKVVREVADSGDYESKSYHTIGLANMKAVVAAADEEFTYDLLGGPYGNVEYVLRSPLTYLKFPMRWKSRFNSTPGFSENMFEYKTFGVGIELNPGDIRPRTAGAEKMDSVIVESMGLFGSIAEYWTKLGKELDGLEAQYEAKKAEYEARFGEL